MNSVLKIAVFISGTGSNLAAIIEKQKTFGYQVDLVVSNKKNASGLDFARQDKIPIYTFDWEKKDNEMVHLQNVIKQHQCELIVLAGFMKILPEPFLNVFINKIINIHPSLLPKYPGLDTHQRAIDNKDKIHGATVHFVNAELDSGKIISQSRIKVEGLTDAKSLAKKLLFREHSLLPTTIALLAQNRVKWHKDSLYFDQKILTTPIEIND